MRNALLLLLALGCTPHLSSPALDDSGPDTWSWQAPENSWEQREPPHGLEGEGWHEGEVAPDFLLLDQHGDLVSLWQFYGMIIAVDHSTMDCVNCRALAKQVDETQAHYEAEGFVYLTLLSKDLDGEVPDVDDLNTWCDAFDVNAPVLSDDAGISEDVVGPGGGYPHLQVIDRDMRMADQQVNPPNDAGLRAAIEALL